MAELENQNNTEKAELFYNVMPSDLKSGPMSESGNLTLPSNTENSTLFERLQAYRFWIILGVLITIILVAGILSYFFYFSKLQPDPIPQNTIVEDTQQANQQDTQQPYTTPKEWQQKFFGSETCLELTICGDDADIDRDGLSNLEEFNLNSDPNNPDSDSDGIADGDEVKIFTSNPLKATTVEGDSYTDADYAKGGYNVSTKQKYSQPELEGVKNKIKQLGFHQPTVETLGDAAFKVYNFGNSGNPETDPNTDSGFDNTPQGKLDRDEARLTTIKRVGTALIKYKSEKGSFPQSTSFMDMFNAIKPYNTVATNPTDPINKDQYTYTYQTSNKNQEFVLTYYSETQNQIIKYKTADAIKNANQEQASLNDETRMRDLENLRSALLVYSEANIDGGQDYVFPSPADLKNALVPKYVSALPKDPKSGQSYQYTTSDTFNTFTLKATFENPQSGTTGYLCNQEECAIY